MKEWKDADIQATLDFVQKTLNTLKKKIRIVPGKVTDPASGEEKIAKPVREQLEELALALQSSLENYSLPKGFQFSCFDGGSDAWCDIRGENLGIYTLQQYYDPQNPIDPSQALHILWSVCTNGICQCF